MSASYEFHELLSPSLAKSAQADEEYEGDTDECK